MWAGLNTGGTKNTQHCRAPSYNNTKMEWRSVKKAGRIVLPFFHTHTVPYSLQNYTNKSDWSVALVTEQHYATELCWPGRMDQILYDPKYLFTVEGWTETPFRSERFFLFSSSLFESMIFSDYLIISVISHLLILDAHDGEMCVAAEVSVGSCLSECASF